MTTTALTQLTTGPSGKPCIQAKPAKTGGLHQTVTLCRQNGR
jgi:hypothetical protein